MGKRLNSWERNSVKSLSLPEVQYVAHELAILLMTDSEPIPDFSTRFPQILESCLITPFQRYGGKDVYPGFLPKAAILFYLMIKNHPFRNGNKRVAVMTLIYFLHKNKKWISIDTRELYNFAVWVAESPAGLKDDVVSGIQKFLKKCVVEIKK